MKRRLLALAGCLALVTSTPAFAQLAPPNDLGVALGHIHLVVKNVDAQKEFWTTMLGGTMVSNGPLTLIQFPGIFIMLRQGEATGPPAGSIVNHFGFVYKDLAAARARWKAAGVKFDVGETNPNQGYVYPPDGSIRVEVFGDPSLPGPYNSDQASHTDRLRFYIQDAWSITPAVTHPRSRSFGATWVQPCDTCPGVPMRRFASTPAAG